MLCPATPSDNAVAAAVLDPVGLVTVVAETSTNDCIVELRIRTGRHLVAGERMAATTSSAVTRAIDSAVRLGTAVLRVRTHEKLTTMTLQPTRLERTTTDAGAELAILTFDDGGLNLFDQAMFDAVIEDIASLTEHPPRALLLRAEGKVVSGGVDVHVFDGLTESEGTALWEDMFSQIAHPLEDLPCPVVYAAHGLTLTAALEIALACDIILAAPRAKFGLVETVVGLTPSMGGPQRMAERAGSGRAREFVMTGDLYDAATMLEWGVVNQIHDDVDVAARALAARLADGPTRAHAATKEIIGAWRSGGVRHADSITSAVSGALFETEDLKGAVRSFLDVGPGKATYTGR